VPKPSNNYNTNLSIEYIKRIILVIVIASVDYKLRYITKRLYILLLKY
jgi:hypothetical protein